MWRPGGPAWFELLKRAIGGGAWALFWRHGEPRAFLCLTYWLFVFLFVFATPCGLWDPSSPTRD